MITLGIDLAAGDKKTALCRVLWSEGSGVVDLLKPNVGDSEIRACTTEADKVGIDAPFGWPIEFVRAVGAHGRLQPWPEVPGETLRLRETDREVRQTVGVTPLSVSTNLIGITAMRAARLLDLLEEDVDCARDGSGRIVEVYPAAALRRWGLPSRGYKRDEARLRQEMLGKLLSRSRVRMAVEDRAVCIKSDDALDAFVAALNARASAAHLCDDIPDRLRERAKVEGWIAVPVEGSLERLA